MKTIKVDSSITRKDIQIGVFGLGFVGLTTALGFAEQGFIVKGYDVDAARLKTIAAGTLPFLEPGLDEALKRHLKNRFLSAESAVEAARESDVLFFCVGTPCGDQGRADLTYLLAALDSTLPVLRDGRFRTLVVKSTVPPGTTESKVIPHLREKGFYDGEGFAVANNPEFLREGKCWEDFMHPDRIVCGTQNKQAAALLQAIYAPFAAPVHIVSLNTGEFIKYLSNTLLASLISYSNEMAVIANAIGDIDTGQAFRILHEDKRLRGSGIASYIFPGCGYGGYCLPKDTQAMAEQAKVHGVEPRLLSDVIAINNDMPAYFVEKVVSSTPTDKCIGILGLSFKPDSDDVRDSPAAHLIRQLLQAGYTHLYAYDPVANVSFDALYGWPQVRYCNDREEVCRKSDVILVATAWSEFKELPLVFPDKHWIDCRYFLHYDHE
ncbi:MAG: UDP-glucose/GDP-mannose dehydrogenase family protein [Prevotellaceae bacterium]|jgi:UDPglucose 6-dehydrogenase|nr:UDP-glucose/GDP-mannose dehydrogenase family protein [Prevotellaceae bacterium]